MKHQQMTLHYSHCVKYTPGELDRAPWSKYETREVTVDVLLIGTEPDDIIGPEYFVRLDGRPLACEEELESALAAAAYKLMDTSRFFQQMHHAWKNTPQGERCELNPEWVALGSKPHLKLVVDSNAFKKIDPSQC